jgi:N-acetylglucosaminyldiphosphoundecaprenol N-acetyl-beta-D-mannosaminyltransferase
MQKVHVGSIMLRTGERHEVEALVRGPGAVPCCVGYLNPHVYNHARVDAGVSAFLAACAFVCLDGVGVSIVGRLQNGTRLSRIVMQQVFDACIFANALRGRAILLGLTPKEQAKATENLRRAAPGLDIVGSFHGFYDMADYRRVLRDHDGVNYVLAGMGTPRSEHVLLEAKDVCRRAACWHVGGGTLRIWAGTKRRAPLVISRMGLEWLHRLILEPETRRRYVLGVPAFIYDVVSTSWAREKA